MTWTCTGPQCSRPAVAEALCASHYRQRLRGRTLSPLRVRPGPEHRLRVVSVRVSPECEERVRSDRSGARAHLERWARRRT